MFKAKVAGKNEEAIRYKILKNDQPLSFREVFSLWKESTAFRQFYIELLEGIHFQAYFWEHPGLLEKYLDKPYEFIIRNSKYLDLRSVNQSAFSDFFNTSDLVVDFDNLGKNARLIVPTPKGDPEQYKHLATFIRSTQEKQKEKLFEQIGTLMLNRLDNNQMIWLNTAGQGVIWLHIRLDQGPKYYKSRTYKNPAFFEK